jgi:four helix bundle protein
VSVPVLVSEGASAAQLGCLLSILLDYDKITLFNSGMNNNTIYRDLVAWQKGVDLCELVYRASAAFPSHEIYGLTSQIRRAAVSVPSNIAEGAGRITRGEYLQSVGYARGSLLEIETQLIVAQRLGYLDAKEIDKLMELTNEIGRVASGLVRALSRTT